MTSFQGAQSPSLLKNQAQVEIVPDWNFYSVQACPPPLGNTAPVEDDVIETTDGKTAAEPESRVGETSKKKSRFSLSKKHETYLQKEAKQVNISQEDEAHFENVLKKVNVIKTVTLKLKNELDDVSLKDPDVFVISGKNHSLFTDILPGETKRSLFAKTPWSWRGAVGICSYRVGKTDDRVVIYYSNPFIGHNSFSLRWVKPSHVTDANTYEKLFSGDNKEFVRDNMKEMKVKSPSGLFLAKAFMTQGEHAEMYATVSDRIDD